MFKKIGPPLPQHLLTDTFACPILRWMPQQLTELDLVFKALSDRTRRSVVERLAGGPQATSQLARTFDMALPSFTQHLGVLQRAGLVTSTKQGRVRTYQLDPSALAVADGWLTAQRHRWEQRLDQLDHFLAHLAHLAHPDPDPDPEEQP